MMSLPPKKTRISFTQKLYLIKVFIKTNRLWYKQNAKLTDFIEAF